MNTQIKITENLSILSDAELVKRYVSHSDLQALHLLIRQRYKQQLKRVMGKYYSGGYDDYDLEAWLDDFYYDLTLPRKSDDGNKLDHYDESMPFDKYISMAARNWAIDKNRQEAKKREQDVPFSENTDGVSDDDGTDRFIDEQEEPGKDWNTSLVLTLELLQDYPPEKRYIVLTYILCNCYKEKGIPVGLSARLAEQLGMNETNVRQEKSRTFKKLQESLKKYKEEDVTFEENDV